MIHYGPVAQQSFDTGATVDSLVMKGTLQQCKVKRVTLPGMDKPLKVLITTKLKATVLLKWHVDHYNPKLGDWVEGLTPEQMDALYAIEDMPAGLTDVTPSVDTTAQNIFKALAIPRSCWC